MITAGVVKDMVDNCSNNSFEVLHLSPHREVPYPRMGLKGVVFRSTGLNEKDNILAKKIESIIHKF